MKYMISYISADDPGVETETEFSTLEAAFEYFDTLSAQLEIAGGRVWIADNHGDDIAYPDKARLYDGSIEPW